MADAERIVGVARQFNLDGITRSTGDLVFTTRRLIFVETGGASDVWGAAFGLIGGLIAGRNSRKASAALQDMSLEEILAGPLRKTEYPYGELDGVTVKPRRVFSSIVVIQPRGAKRKRLWGAHKGLGNLVDAAEDLRRHGLAVEVR